MEREPLPPVWNEPWAIEASVKADLIENRMRVAVAGLPGLTPAQEQARCAVESHVSLARRATARDQHWRGTVDWWRGTSVQRAYQSLHAAEIFLVDLLPTEEVRTTVPNVVAKADACLGPNDPRRIEIDRLPAMSGELAYRAAVKSAMEFVYDANDQLHVRVRDFRNLLLTSAFLIAALVAGLVVLVSMRPQALPFCFDPDIDTAGIACPTGDLVAAASGGDGAIVAGLGLLGGALAAAFSIRNIRGTSTPYDVPKAQALLKVPSGALTATAGILLLGGGFVPGLSELDSQRQILAYALVLGYAQQLATRFVDDRAQSILGSVPSKESMPADGEPRPAPRPAPRRPATPEAEVPAPRVETPAPTVPATTTDLPAASPARDREARNEVSVAPAPPAE